MNIEDVRAFVATVETGSVGRAALRLNLTQPAVSRRIQRLEESLGVALLDRESKPARPTRAGESAYRRCVAVLRATEVLRQETRGAADAGPLRIGLTYAISDSILAPAVDALQVSCPDITLRVTTDRSSVLRKHVDDGLLDVAIVSTLPDRLIDDPRAARLGTERVAVVASHSLERNGRKLADFADLPWVINPEGCGFRMQLDNAVAQNGRALHVRAEIWGADLQAALVARGAGLGLLPGRLVANSIHKASLRVLDLEDFQASVAIWLVRSGPVGPFERGIDMLGQTVARLLNEAA